MFGASADPSAVQHVQVAIDALVTAEVRPFWRAVLGYAEVGEEDLLDPLRRGPSFWFQAMDSPRPQRNRIHIDVYVPRDQAEARVAAAGDGWSRRERCARARLVDPGGRRGQRGRPGNLG